MPTSNGIDWPATLPLPLVGSRKILQPRNEVHTMESKRIRIRRYYEDYLTLVDFVWNFTEDEFEAFKEYFEDDLVNGEYPFIITLPDPSDPLQQTVTEYGFYEATYQFSRSDNLYNVTATMVVEDELVEVIPEPFVPGLCGVVLWPEVSDGEGGGTTFECYPTGVDYSEDQMEPAGTAIAVVYNYNSPFFAYGETFEWFSVGTLVLGSPSSGSHLLVMRYGDNPFRSYGDDFETHSVGAFTGGHPPADTELLAYYYGDGP